MNQECRQPLAHRGLLNEQQEARHGIRGSLWVIAVMAVFGLPVSAAAQAPVQIDVNAGRVIHTMAGGAGASWHAMGPDAYWYKDLNRNNRNSRGSGWGGNPPLEYSAAWDDLRKHARWLGLDLDEARNGRGTGSITADGSAVSAWVIPTDEERMIARQTAKVMTLGRELEKVEVK